MKKFDVRDYMETAFSRVTESAGGGHVELQSECPSCEKFGSFYVNQTTGAYVCFSCNFRGRNAVGLVAEVEGISREEARRYIFRRSVKLPRKSDLFTLADNIRAIRPHAVDEDEEVPPVDHPLPPEFTSIWDEKTGRYRVPQYLKERGISKRTAKAWGLGYCRGGRYSNRLIIPCVSPSGRSFTAREMTLRGSQPKSPVKYLNPKGADHSRLLIGWHAARLVGDLVLCEGPLDAVRLWQFGINALALGGKVIHDEQISQLLAIQPHPAIVIMLDPEEQTAPIEVASALRSHFEDISIATLPEGLDPGHEDLTSEQAHDAVDEARQFRSARKLRLGALLRESRSSLASRHG